MFPPGSPFNPQSPQQQTPQLTIAQRMLENMNRAIVFDRQLLDLVRQIGRDVSLMASRQATAQQPLPSPVPPPAPPANPSPASQQGGNWTAGLLDAVRQFAQSVPILGGGLSQLFAASNQFAAASANLARALAAPSLQLARAVGSSRIGKAVAGKARAVGSLVARGAKVVAGKVKSVAGPAIGKLAKFAAPAVGGLAKVAAPIAGAAGAVGAVAAAGLAALAAAGVAAGLAVAGIGAAAMKAGEAILGMAQAASKYVEAFAPSTVMAFNLAMRDLNATIGVALQPVVQTGTAFARMLAATLLPITKQLSGIFEQLSKSILSVAGTALDAFGKVMEEVIPIVESVVGIIKDAVAPVLNAVIPVIGKLVAAVMPVVRLFIDALAPVLKMFSNLLTGIAHLFDAAAVVLYAFVDSVSSIFRSIGSALGLGGLGDVFSSLKNVMRDVARYGMLAAASLAKFFNWTSFVQGMIKAMEPAKKEDATGIAAVKNAQFQSFADFGKSVSIAASTASGKYGEMSKEEAADAAYKAETLRQLKEIADGKSFLQVIAAQIIGLRQDAARPGYDGSQDRRRNSATGTSTAGTQPIF